MAAILNGGFIRSDSILDAGFITLGDVARLVTVMVILWWQLYMNRQIEGRYVTSLKFYNCLSVCLSV